MAPNRRARWIGVLALLFLAGGAAVAIRLARRPAAGGPPPFAVPEAAPLTAADSQLTARDGIVGDALRGGAPVDSAELRSRWVDEVKGADLSGLGAESRELLLRFANARRCTCGCAFTLAGCRTFDPTCEVSGPIVLALRDSIASGWLRDARGLRARPDSGR